MKLSTRLHTIPKVYINIIGILSVLLVGALDSLTGSEISFSILYLIPVTFVAWYSSKSFAVVVAVISVISWLAADVLTGVVYSHVTINIWNGLSRFGIYYFVIYLERYIKDKYQTLELNIQEKTADLSIEKIEHKRTFESVRKLSLFPELNPNPILELDSRKNLTYCNKAADDFLNKVDGIYDFSVFFPDDLDIIIGALADKKQTAFYREKKIGSVVLEEYIYLIHSFQVVQIYAVDITDRKNAEESIKKSLKEKEILLREIHHRVKNNLQIISSLLKLQSAFVKDKNDLSVFVESQNRISSIAGIHKMLYESPDISSIDAGGFFDQLIQKLFHVYNADTNCIITLIETNGITLDTDTANPLGLLITEIVSNSLKYAFPNSAKGEVVITMSDESEVLILEVGDSGLGMPKEVEYTQSPTLGLQLIDLLTQQLGGSYSRTSNDGTKYIFKFKRQAASV